MKVIINGERIETDAQTLEKLVKGLGYEGKKIAVAVDGKFVARQAYDNITLREDTEIEVVAPMQGG